MAKVISFQSRKGGTGKTTSALTFSEILAGSYKVLLVDADEQANSTRRFFNRNKVDYMKVFEDLENVYGQTKDPIHSLNTIYATEKVKGTFDVLINPQGIKECIHPTSNPNLWICPSSEELIKADQMVLMDTRNPQQTRFSKAFRIIRDQFDYIIIDNAPSANMTIINSLFASDLVIITLKSGGDELDGLRKTLADISEINENFGMNINYKILLTMVHRQKRTVEKKEKEILKKLFGDRLYDTDICYQDAAVTKASVESRSLLHHKTNVREDYSNLVKEFISKGGDQNVDGSHE